MLSDEVSDDGRDAERVEFGLRSRWGDHVGRSSIGKPSRKWSIPDSNLTLTILIRSPPESHVIQILMIIVRGAA